MEVFSSSGSRREQLSSKRTRGGPKGNDRTHKQQEKMRDCEGLASTNKRQRKIKIGHPFPSGRWETERREVAKGEGDGEKGPWQSGGGDPKGSATETGSAYHNARLCFKLPALGDNAPREMGLTATRNS